MVTTGYDPENGQEGGSAILGGTLNLDNLVYFTTTPDDVITLIVFEAGSGEFTTVNYVPIQLGDYSFDLEYDWTSVSLVVPPADTEDDDVDPTEDSEFDGAVETFDDPGFPDATPDDFEALLDYGDGNEEEGTIVANGSGGFDIYGSKCNNLK